MLTLHLAATVFTSNDGGVLSAPAATSSCSGFYVDPSALRSAQAVRTCMDDVNKEGAIAQFLFEVDMTDALEAHPERVTQREDACLEYVPFLSHSGAKCDPVQKHAAAMVARAVPDSPHDNLPRALTFVGVMQSGTMGGDAFTKLIARNASLIQLTQAPRFAEPSKLSVSNHVMVVPYHSPASANLESRTCTAKAKAGSRGAGAGAGVSASFSSSDGAQMLFRGSPHVADAHAAAVRQHIVSLSSASPAILSIKATDRGKDISGLGTELTAQSNGKTAKDAMLDAMASSQYCLVPEGDSPETSRLFDAVGSLCTPIVLSKALPVPLSQHSVWQRAAIVVDPDVFLHSYTTPQQLLDYANNVTEQRGGKAAMCDALQTLRSDLSARSMLSTLVKHARSLLESGPTRSAAFELLGVSQRVSTDLPIGTVLDGVVHAEQYNYKPAANAPLHHAQHARVTADVALLEQLEAAASRGPAWTL